MQWSSHSESKKNLEKRTNRIDFGWYEYVINQKVSLLYISVQAKQIWRLKTAKAQANDKRCFRLKVVSALRGLSRSGFRPVLNRSPWKALSRCTLVLQESVVNLKSSRFYSNTVPAKFIVCVWNVTVCFRESIGLNHWGFFFEEQTSFNVWDCKNLQSTFVLTRNKSFIVPISTMFVKYRSLQYTVSSFPSCRCWAFLQIQPNNNIIN